MSDLRKTQTQPAAELAQGRAGQRRRTIGWSVAVISALFLMANLGAIVDAILHPEIDYFDSEHLIVGLVSALVVGTMIAIIRVYLGRIENALQSARQTEAALQMSEARYRAIFEQAPVGFFQSTPAGRYLTVNPAMARMFGYASPAEMLESITDIASQIHVDPARRQDFMRLMAERGEVLEFVNQNRHKDGHHLHTLNSARAVCDSTGGILYYEGFMTDITARKDAEAALQQSEERYRTLYENSTIGIYRTTPAGDILLANPALVKMLGYASVDELRARNLDQGGYEPAYSRSHFLEMISQHGEVRGLESAWQRRDGTALYVRESARAIYTAQGEIACFDGTVEDITDRKQAEDALRISESLFHSLVEVSPLSICRKDRAGQFTFANRRFLEDSNITLADLVGRTDFDIHPPQLAGKYQRDDGAVIASGQVMELIEERTLVGGASIVVQSIKTPIYDGAGNINGVQIAFWDITARQQAEDVLRESERRLREIIDNAPFGAHVYELGPDRRLVLSGANRAADSILGVDHQQFVGKAIEEAFPPLSQTDIPDAYRRVAATGERYDAEQVDYARGSIRGAFEVHAIQTGPNRMVAFFRDVTERKQAEQAEREARQLAEALRDTATGLTRSLEMETVLDQVLFSVARVVPHDGANVLLVDGDEAVVARVIGRCPADTIGVERYVIDDTANLHTMRTTGEPCIIDRTRDDPRWRTRPGDDWIASYAGVPIQAAGSQPLGYLGLYSTEPGHFSARHAERLKIFAAQVALSIQNAQLHSRIQLHAEDLEARVQERTRQLSEANAQLSDLDRLKDDFISRISHELRTPLTSIKIYLELLETGKPEKRAKYMQVLGEQTNRLQQLIESLLEVTQKSADTADLHIAPTDLNHLAASLAADAAPRAAQRGLTLTHAQSPDLPLASADSVLLAQALSNLVTNALNYTPAGGVIDLTTAQVIDQGESWLTLSVRDTGPGIAPDELSHLFDRFYRGKAAADYKTPGAGVGLTVSRDILAALGGRLTVDSRPGAGTTFTAWLRPA